MYWIFMDNIADTIRQRLASHRQQHAELLDHYQQIEIQLHKREAIISELEQLLAIVELPPAYTTDTMPLDGVVLA